MLATHYHGVGGNHNGVSTGVGTDVGVSTGLGTGTRVCTGTGVGTDVSTGNGTRLQQCRFSEPLKLEWRTDREGDRRACSGRYEESNHDKFEWMPRPVENGKYFTLENRHFGMPLKLEWYAEYGGDQGAFGGNADQPGFTAIQKVISAATENCAFQLGYELRGQPLISYFPDAVQLILRGSHIRLQQCRFSAPLKLGWHTDRDGDRAAYAGRYEESNHDENRRFGMPLKLEWHTDYDGDWGAFGGSTERGIEPGWLFRLNSNGSVTIQNRMFNMYLKVSALAAASILCSSC
ncbi:hypothetical protein Pelo_4085 [Pelomyxa schiedti]|nr:hypothetical protein Pelo_4085 [Pelomyxa schiedti]